MVTQDTTASSHWRWRGHVTPMCPIIALWSLTDTDGGIIKTMFMMTVSSSVATTRCECFVFILEVPALPRLVALVVHQLVAVVLVFLAHLHSPGLVDPGMLLTKPASHGVSLGGGGAGGGPGGAAVEGVAHVPIAGADCVVAMTIRIIIIVSTRVAEDGIIVAHV